jgi:hypothetical protein
MSDTLDKRQFRDQFSDRMLVLDELPGGRARQLAESVNENEGGGDAALHTKAEYSALFEALLQEPGSAAGSGRLRLLDANGNATSAGRLLAEYRAAAKGKTEFFAGSMYVIQVNRWGTRPFPPNETPVEAGEECQLQIWLTASGDGRTSPPPGPDGILFNTNIFSLANSGNRTATSPKRSWKIELKARGERDEFNGMIRFNLKAMYNDPSQMRETLAWDLLDAVGIPACRHSYAKLSIDGRYLGLFFLVEQPDRRFLRDHFGSNDRGNLYKVYYGDLAGGGGLLYRRGQDGNDNGRQYISPTANATYRLKTNENDNAANTYEDLADHIRRVNGLGLAGQNRFQTEAFRTSIEDIFNVRPFLRWAGANLLMGSWDNYFATPANYYLYNSGKRDRAIGFLGSPFFTFLPWDYDNSFGIDYSGTEWQYTDLIDWPANTANYLGRSGARSRIPLVENLLHHPDFASYYLDHLEYLLDTSFNPDVIAGHIGSEGAGGLWDRVRRAAYLESNTPGDHPFTGRQFTNDQVYRGAYLQEELRGDGNSKIYGIVNYVRMRYDRARSQLAILRQTFPRGSSGAAFPTDFEALP